MIKKLQLFIVVTICLFTCCYSQNDIATHFYDDFPDRVATINGFKFVISQIQTPVYDSSIIVGISPNGKIKFRKFINLFEVSKINSVAITSDSCLLAIGSYTSNCDVLCGGDGFLIKLDTSGAQKFFVTNHNPFQALCPSNNTAMINYPAGLGNYIFSENYTAFYFEDGTLWQGQSNHLGLVHSGLFNDSIIIVSNSVSLNMSTTNYLTYLNLSGDSIISIPVNFTLKKIVKNSLGELFGLTHLGELLKFDNNLNVIQSSILSQGNLIISDFEIKQDTLYACASNSLTIVKFDKDLNNVYQKNNIYSNIKLSSISISQNTLTLAGNESPNVNYQHPNGIIFNTNMSGDITLTNDTYIQSVSVLNHTISIPSSTVSPIYVDVYFNLSVNVFNLGTDTLKSVYINYTSNFYPPLGCGLNYFHHLVNNISIPPNNSANVITPVVHDYKEYNTGIPLPSDTIVFNNICIWSSAPNFKGDANHSNDVLCKNLSFPIIVTDAKQNSSFKDTFIYPNPTNSNVIIELNTNYENAKLFLFDINGKELLMDNFTSSKIQLSFDKYLSGIYFLKIFTQDRVIIRKIIKE